MTAVLRTLTASTLVLAACQVQGVSRGPAAPTSATAPPPSGDPNSPPPDDRANGAAPSRSGDDQSSSGAGGDTGGGGGASVTITIPDVMGLDRPSAEAKLRAAGVRGDINLDVPAENYDFAVAKVCNVEPEAGAHTGSRLSVTLGFCPNKPRQDRIDAARRRSATVVGLSIEDAKKLARDMGYKGEFKVEPLTQFDPHCAANIVCSAEPAGYPWDTQGLNQPWVLWVSVKPKFSAPD